MRLRILFITILSTVAWMTVAHVGHALGAATPEAEPTATVEMLAETTATGDGGIALYRIVLPPGASVDEHPHDGPAIWYIAEGTLTYTATDGMAQARCGGGCLREGTPAAAASAEETLPTGAPVTLEAGDLVVLNATASHAYRNDGDVPVVILVSTTAGSGVPDRCGGGCL